jgi:hypothetical protein
LVIHLTFLFFTDEDKNTDRLPIIVTGEGIEQLLGVPELQHGTGLCAADAVVHHVNDWEAADQCIGLVFDTTAHNTGRVNGAVVLIQQKLNKDLLELACRHHVFELLLGAVFDDMVGISKNPDLLFVDCLQKKWREIDRGKHCTL